MFLLKVENTVTDIERVEYKKRKKERSQKYRERINYKPYERERDKMLRCKYGITYANFQEMKNEQNGKCYICKNIDDRLCVDHCHETKKVRRLLCDNCNIALGLIKENEKTLINMINYLKEFIK